MMTYEDFYWIASESINCGYELTERDIACNANTYMMEFEKSIQRGRPTPKMIIVCKNLQNECSYKDNADLREITQKLGKELGLTCIGCPKFLECGNYLKTDDCQEKVA